MKDNNPTPKLSRNRPGLSQINYRISDYNRFFERLLSRLSQGEDDVTRPLLQFTTRSRDDAAIALLDAWAIMADVLTFYQERIVNEGYVRTAIERRSLLELARAIGYELNPGVVASTYLSFTVEEAPDSPTVTQIAKGTAVSSVPEGEELPQIFETTEDFTAYVQWNVITPRDTRPQTIAPETTQLYLTGIDTQLEAGDYLLLLDKQEKERVYLLKLSSVESNSDKNYTLVTFPKLDNLTQPLRQPQVFAFRGEASFFGSNAPQWDTLSTEDKRSAIEADQDQDEIEVNGVKIDGGVITINQNNNQWKSNLVGQGLPNLDISDLVINQEGDVFVAIPSRGIFRLFSESDRWVEINDGLSNINIQTLYVNERGHLFAGGSNGTAGGGAFRSKDNGNSWTEIATGTIGVEPVPNSGGEFRAVNTSIFNTVVRSFLTYEENGVIYIFVGTDNGVYRSIDGGKNWYSFNNNLLSNETAIRSLVFYGKNFENSEFSIYNKQEETVRFSVDAQDKIIINLETNEQDNIKKAHFSILAFLKGSENLGLLLLWVMLLQQWYTLQKGDIIEVEKQFRIVEEVINNNTIRIDYPLLKNVEESELIIYKKDLKRRPKYVVFQFRFLLFLIETNRINLFLVLVILLSTFDFAKVSLDNQDKKKVNGDVNTKFEEEIESGDIIEVAGHFRIVENIENDNELKVSSLFVSIIAGTDNGVFELKNITNNSPNWSEKNTGIDSDNLDDRDISILIDDNKNELYLGTKNRKIYRFPQIDDTDSWEKIGQINSDKPQKITALAINSETKKLVVGTAKQGLYYQNNENRFEKIESGDNQQKFPTAITALQFDQNQNKFFVGTRFSGFFQEEWPNFEIEPEKIQLDTLYPQILNDSLIVILNDDYFEEHKVNKISQPFENRFNLSLEITEIESNKPIENPEKFNRRNSKILIESEPLELAPEKLTIVARGEDIFLDPIQQETFLEPVKQEFTQTKNIFLSEFIENLNRDQTIIISGQYMTAEIQDIGGIFCSQNQQRTDEELISWEPSNVGLTNSQVTSLVINSQESKKELLVGTTQGIFHSLDDGNRWEPIDSWKKIENKLENKEIQALLVNNNNIIFVGTAEGLFKSEDQGNSWQQIKEETGLIYNNILVLNETKNEKENILLVGTLEGGLFQFKDKEQTWTSLGLYDTDVTAIAIQKQQADNYHLFVGTTQQGIFRSLDQGNSWEKIIETREGKGRLSSENNQVTWRGSNFNQHIKPGDTINAAGQTRTITNVFTIDNSEATLSIDNPFQPDLINQNFTIDTGLANRSITAIALGSREIKAKISIDNNTITDTENQFTNLLKVRDTLTLHVNGKIQTQTITQISEKSVTVEQPFELDENQPINNQTKTIIINQNLIFAGTSGSGVFRSQDNGDYWEAINVNLTDLEIRCLTVDTQGNIWVGTAKDGVFQSNNNGDIWIPFNNNLDNIDVQTIVIENNTIFVGGIGILIAADRLQTTPIQRHDTVEILTPPLPMVNQEEKRSYQRWTVRNKDGFEGHLTTELPSQPLTLNQITLLPAPEDSERVSEIATIAIPPQDEQLPILILKDPLKNAYDPQTVTIYGNVVPATHGETVEEILGSGDGNATNQTFTLQEPPLTYISAPTPSGRESSLEVRINGVLWQEVPSLYPLKPHDQNYIIRIQDDGTTNVTFGDGKKGSRLPTGVENITATYRQGIGSDGNVGANSLSILNNTPPSVGDVINPLKATGGTDPETLSQIRQNAPSTVRILDRIVSLEDFEDFARSFTGIGKAIATPIWQQGREIVHLTIATDTGETVPETSRLYSSLVTAIDQAKDPRQPVMIDSYQAIRFNVEAQLTLDPKYEPEQVISKVRDALIKTFDFPVRNFGQPVTTAEAIASMQKVEGVIAVDLNALYQSDRSKVLNQSLSASLAYYDPRTNQTKPAQLLLINPSGIRLI
ncbi:putative baseplate assembly protein [Crocosphaera sp.]|uniref:putative baseplate assembly protein n=1 Tax=Crocosphaera sp. TaxID=2729996 RepID=UPI0026240033|nr:putative baseplate assembly protein [Crocosphaera sp.]MDJ0579761.1 putative baseplate assembly protein [Crocosphaera sp.]